MSLRRRLTLMAALSVGIAVIAACVACYVAVRAELDAQIDDGLRSQSALIRDRAGRFPRFDPRVHRELPAPPPREGGGAGFIQVITPQGRIRQAGPTELRLPIDAATRRLAATPGPAKRRDVDVAGNHLRVLTVHVNGLGAVQLARSLDANDRVLDRLRLILAAVAILGIALAAALGRWTAKRVIAPIARLTDATAQVAATDDLSLRVGASGDDEVGRLAARFDTMMERLEASRAALDASAAAQRQLVADASHELRTPITSLRTNVELLQDGAVLDPDERQRLLADAVQQADELSALVTDVVELARGDQPGREPQDVRLDALVEEAAARVRLHAPGVDVVTDLESVAIEGQPDRLARALNNLLDNAARHSPPGGPVEVRQRGGTIVVRDHGDGIPPDDLPHVFDRFHRGANARERPGSGLGLAIVRQVVDAHGGTVRAANAADGGAELTLSLPGAARLAELASR